MTPATRHFLSLPVEQQREAVRRLAATGASVRAIADLTGLHPAVVRRAIATGAHQVSPQHMK